MSKLDHKQLFKIQLLTYINGFLMITLCIFLSGCSEIRVLDSSSAKVVSLLSFGLAIFTSFIFAFSYDYTRQRIGSITALLLLIFCVFTIRSGSLDYQTTKIASIGSATMVVIMTIIALFSDDDNTRIKSAITGIAYLLSCLFLLIEGVGGKLIALIIGIIVVSELINNLNS